jgi:hypothetical protein
LRLFHRLSSSTLVPLTRVDSYHSSAVKARCRRSGFVRFEASSWMTLAAARCSVRLGRRSCITSRLAAGATTNTKVQDLDCQPSPDPGKRSRLAAARSFRTPVKLPSDRLSLSAPPRGGPGASGSE